MDLLADTETADVDLKLEAIAFLRRAATKEKSRNFFVGENFRRWFCNVASQSSFWNDGVKFEKFRRFFWQFLFNLSVGRDEFIFDAERSDDANIGVSFNDVFCLTLKRSDDDKLNEVLTGIIHQRLQHLASVSSF